MKIKQTILTLAVGIFLFSVQTWAQSFTFSGGDGTQGNPFLISNQKDLTDLSNAVNGRTGTANAFEGVYFKQTQDIALTRSFVPIGHRFEDSDGRGKFVSFKGIYNGDYHTISNLLAGDYEINDFTLFQADCIGLFGCVEGNKAKVEKVFITSGKVRGQYFVGAIVGILREGATVENCGVGTNMEVLASVGFIGGLVGGATRSFIKKCVNYSDVYCRAANSFNAGGIVGSSDDSHIEGCANYGDVFSPHYAGGILGSMPISKNVSYEYYPVISCYNAGVISTSFYGAGGIMGAWPYQGNVHKIAVKNSYNYGRAFSPGAANLGPIIAVCLPSNNNQSSSNVYYDEDRFVNKKKENNANGFIHGEAVTHQAMYSNTTLNLLNDDNSIPFVADKNKINQNYPIHEWLNDLYNNHKNVYDELTKAYPDNLYNYSMEAGYLFLPNKYGKFYFINKDKQEPVVAFKSEGARRGQAMFIRNKATKGNSIQKVFTCTSFFAKPLDENYMFVTDESKIPAADRWLITPEFTVDANYPYFYWDAASEDESYKEGYEVFVGGENDITAEAYANAVPVYKTEGEDPLSTGKEDMVDDKGEHYERTYFIFNRKKVDLSKYIGKKVRIAFHDNTHYKFSLMLANMGVGTKSDNAVQDVHIENLNISVLPDHSITVSAVEGTKLYLYSVDGTMLQKAETKLTYQSLLPTVCILKAEVNGQSIIRKVQL